MVTAIAGMPGHWRKTTRKQRAILYGIVILVVGSFTIFLFRVLDKLEQEYSIEEFHKSWDSF